MKPDDFDRILDQAAHPALPPDAGRDAIERVERALMRDLRPVQLLAPLWVFALAFLVLFAALAAISATALGLHGIHALSQGQRALIFPALLLAAWLAAVACVREMRPAAGLRLGALALALAAVGFPALFSLVFHNYSFQNFVDEGVPCLVAGLSVSIPAGVLMAFILRRGFVMEWSMAGVAAGTLAGLTGLGMLELHCQNLKAIHVIVWHVAVVVASGFLGFTIGWIADEFRRRKAI